MLVPFLNTGLQDVSQTSWDQSLQAVWAKWNRSHCPKIYSWQGCCWLTRRGHKHHSNHAITSKLFCLISALMQKSGQHLLCLLWPPWSIIKAPLWLSTPCFPPISACLDGQGNIETWMLGATGPLAAGTPASKWSQGYSQSTCQVCVWGGTPERKGQCKRLEGRVSWVFQWRKNKRTALWGEGSPVSGPLPDTHSGGTFGNAMWDKEEACRVVLVTWARIPTSYPRFRF